ncbi:hypothetical protein Tco_0030045, partial [Tanacetum coccineum]
DGGVLGVSLSVVSSADDKNGEIAGNGGIWSNYPLMNLKKLR